VKKRKAFRQIDAIRSTPAVKRRLRRSFVELHSRRKSGGSKQVSFADTVEDSMLKADNQEVIGKSFLNEIRQRNILQIRLF